MKRYAAYDPPEYVDWDPDPELVDEYERTLEEHSEKAEDPYRRLPRGDELRRRPERPGGLCHPEQPGRPRHPTRSPLRRGHNPLAGHVRNPLLDRRRKQRAGPSSRPRRLPFSDAGKARDRPWSLPRPSAWGGAPRTTRPKRGPLVPAELFEVWGRRDPVGLLEEYMRRRGFAEAHITTIEEEAAAVAESAAEAALASLDTLPEPELALYEGFSQGNRQATLERRPMGGFSPGVANSP